MKNSHIGDYSREEKIRLTAIALGIAIPTRAIKITVRQKITEPIKSSEPLAIYTPHLVISHQKRTAIKLYDSNNIYEPGWGVFRKQAFNNLLFVEHCSYCQRKGSTTKDPDGTSWHIDHIVPSSKGGTNELNNLCKSCMSCNVHKSDKDWKPVKGTIRADGSIE